MHEYTNPRLQRSVLYLGDKEPDPMTRTASMSTLAPGMYPFLVLSLFFEWEAQTV